MEERKNYKIETHYFKYIWELEQTIQKVDVFIKDIEELIKKSHLVDAEISYVNDYDQACLVISGYIPMNEKEIVKKNKEKGKLKRIQEQENKKIEK